MDLDFEDVLGVELPFVRDNPGEVEVVELNANGEVVDVIATNPEYLGALEDDYYLEPTIDPVTDEMPFEMSELYPDELGIVSLSLSGSAAGRLGTSGATGTARISTSRQAAIDAAKRKRKLAIEAARARLRKATRAKEAAAKKRRQAARAARVKARPKRVVPSKVRGRAIMAATPRAMIAARPRIVARPKLATAGVTCGCAQIGRIENMLKKAATQRLATSEHRTIINQKSFRRKTVGQLNAILGRLSHADRSKVIRAACGMGSA